MSSKVNVFSDTSSHSTARYFERAVQVRTGDSSLVCWGQVPPINDLQADDVLFVVDPAPDWPLGLEKAPCLTMVYFIDVHQGLDARLQMSHFFDVVFVAQKDYVARFLEIGHANVHWLPLACDPGIHHLPVVGRPIDVGFVGKLGLWGSPRYRILTTVLPRYRTNDYRKFYDKSDMAGIYCQSKIVFNASINGDLNMRVFEAFAAGALLVTDRIENGLSELFQEGVHYVGYGSIQEAIEKIDHYLANPSERDAIALEGQRVALAHHTYLQRWEMAVDLSRGRFGQAPARRYLEGALGGLYSSIFVSLRLPQRIVEVVRQYGSSLEVLRNLVLGWGRWLNARVPLTPNAFHVRLRASLARRDVR